MKKLNFTAVFAFLTVLSYTVPSKANAQDLLNPEEKQSLVNSDGSMFQPQDSYPRFSWSVTPMYFMFGDSKRILKPEEVSFITEMMGSLKKKLGPDKILLGNNASQEIAQYVFPLFEAIMFEYYNGELLSKLSGDNKFLHKFQITIDHEI